MHLLSKEYIFICVFVLVVIQIQSTFSKPLTSFKKKNENLLGLLNILQIDRNRREVRQSCEDLKGRTETWGGHNASFNWEYSEESFRVQVYTDTKNKHKVNVWIFYFTNQVWEYMTRTYVDFDSSQCLHVVIHCGYYAGGRIVYARNSSSIPANYNILDIGSTSPNSFKSNEPSMDEMDLLTNYLAHFVEFSSKNRFGSPSENIWKGSSSEHSAWVDIFTYDVYKSLNYTMNAELYRNKSLLKSHNSSFSASKTFWFRDWLLPIYEQFGGNAVLNNYFEILSSEIPHSKENLNIGEFVHLWCGAARFDLTSMARKAFGWNEDYKKLFNEARVQFNGTKTLYKIKVDNIAWSTSTSTILSPSEVTIPVVIKNFASNQTTLSEISQTSSSQATDTSYQAPQDDQRQYIFGGGAVIFILFALLVMFVIYYKRKVRYLRTEMRSLTNKEMRDFFEGDSSANENEAHSLIHSSPFVKDFEISRDRWIFNPNNVIGSGEFGCVMHGFIRQLDSEELLPVAIKTVKANVEVPQFKAMLSEAKIMAFLGKHENIVLLCGTYTANIRNREIYIALELCALGDLRNFLKNNAKEYKHQPFPVMLERNSSENVISDNCISTLNLYKWSQEISNGMMYLAEKKVIHGDLATRNVLLTSNRVAKISDFGLSRQLLNYEHYLKTTRTPLPWRWLAVEALKDMKFSVASDVWAFGVTLWEIFSLGETPYPGCTWDCNFVNRLIGGERLQAPAYADDSTYQLMLACWMLDASERPLFQTIHNTLGELVAKHTPTREPDYLELVPLESESETELEFLTELEV